MATHSSILAWRIPGTGEPGGLPSMGSHRVGHDWSDLAAAGSFDCFETGKHFRYLVGRDQKCQPSVMHMKVPHNKTVLFKMSTEPLPRNTRIQKGEQIHAYQKLNTSTKCRHLFYINLGENMYHRNPGKGEKMWRGWATMCTFTDV